VHWRCIAVFTFLPAATRIQQQYPPTLHTHPPTQPKHQGTEGGITAAKAGHSVIMTPTSHCYFDYRQANK